MLELQRKERNVSIETCRDYDAPLSLTNLSEIDVAAGDSWLPSEKDLSQKRFVS